MKPETNLPQPAKHFVALILATVLFAAILLLLPMTATAEEAGSQDHVAFYTVTFHSDWSQQTHPGFPPGAHYSPLIGATHSMSATLWMSDTLASPGIEQMAETGGITTLHSEIAGLGNGVREVISAPGMRNSPGLLTTPTFSASRSHPYVTLVSMIAPSPDWFIGVQALPLLDDQGRWRQTVTIPLVPYDAGTDDGLAYGLTRPGTRPTSAHSQYQRSGPLLPAAPGHIHLHP